GCCRELQGYGWKEAGHKEKNQCQVMKAESWTLCASAMAQLRVVNNRVADVLLQRTSPKPLAIPRKNWLSPRRPIWASDVGIRSPWQRFNRAWPWRIWTGGRVLM